MDETTEMITQAQGMTTSEIMTLVVTIFTAIAALAAAVSCYLAYRNAKPKIKVEKGDDPEYSFFIKQDNKSVFVIGLNIINQNSVTGMIDDIFVVHNNHPYYAEIASSNYSLQNDISMEFSNASDVSLNEMRLKLPLTIDGYSIKYGFFLILGLPEFDEEKICFDVHYKIIGKRRTRKIKNVEFTNSSQIGDKTEITE